MARDETTWTATGDWRLDGGSTPQLALAIAWSHAEPARIGEVAQVPPGGPWILGRGDGPGRLVFTRQRPGDSVPRAGLADPRISREQLAIRVAGDRLEVANRGRRALRVAGGEVSQARVGEGDTVQVDGQLVLVVVLRAAVLPAAREQTLARHPFGEPDAQGLIGESPAMWALRDRIAFVGPRPVHALVHGPSGSGKELVARALHALSPRRARPLVSRSAATLPDSLVDAELFGNRRNYPNPGMPERVGLVGESDGSTLFLDEIGELPHSLQARLLRVLDADGEYTRLGESRPRHADLRLVAATNRPLAELKHDLAARLEIRIAVSGLDTRREDVPLLARHFLRELARQDPSLGAQYLEGWDGSGGEPRVDPALVEALVRHQFTHHARELRQLLWQAMSESPGPFVGLTEGVQAALRTPARDAGELTPQEIQAALDRNNGNQAATWRELGLRNRDVLYRLIRKHNLEIRKGS